MNKLPDYLQELEAEAIYIIREVYGQLKKPCILFSGGKDSIVLTHLVIKAFYPSKMSIPLVHIDTGHNFPETIAFRDAFVSKYNLQLIIGSVQESIEKGTAREEHGQFKSRNKAQSVTLLETIAKHKFDAALGGGRRDEEKARAKERIFSHRNSSGKWSPTSQRPELWHTFNGLLNPNEHFRIFPISNWTELDIWSYIVLNNIELPSLYYAHKRSCFRRGNTILAHSAFVNLNKGEELENLTVRFRTIGDMTISGALESTADSPESVLDETKEIKFAERSNRADDLGSTTSMEDRKRDGYF